MALQIGFQGVTIQKSLLVLNNQMNLLCGVNYHLHDAETGHVLSLSSMLRNIALLQTNNFNTVSILIFL